MASTDKYDRQTRLWGSHGQRLLAESRICLLTAGPTGTESLKNLVLPGCGFVSVVDGETVTEGDVGNNFFVDPDSIGKPRAEVALAHLLEMNPDVTGEAHNTFPADLIGSNPAFFESFTLVIASQLQRDTLLALSSILWALDVPLISARSYGLIGHLRVARPVHVCYETKDVQAKADLRIANPFPALAAMAAKFNLATVDDETHRHLPFPILLILLIQKYEAETGARPKTFSERKAFGKWIETQRRDITTDEGTPIWEENFDEAVANASLATLIAAVPADVAEVLSDAKLDSLTAKDSDFWFLARALREFQAAEGAGTSLPVTTALPDMTATTALYLELSEAYRSQAAADKTAFEAHLSCMLEAAGRTTPVPEDVVTRFLASSRSIKVIRYRQLAEELATTGGTAAEASASSAADDAAAAGRSPRDGAYTGNLKEAVEEVVAMHPEEAEMAPMLWQVMLRAADDFEAKHGRFPGAGGGCDLGADAAEVEALAAVHAAGYGVADRISAKHAAEMTRYGACEPHVTAAVVGAVASQEAIKLITGQYVPLNNTFVFNGIASRADQAEL